MAINAFFSIHLVDIGAESALVGAAWAIGALVEIPVMLGYPWLGGRFGVERLLLVGASAFLVRPSPCWSCATRCSSPPPWPCTASASRWCWLAASSMSRATRRRAGRHCAGRAGRHGVRRGRHPRPGRRWPAGRLAGTGGHVHGRHRRLRPGRPGAGLGVRGRRGRRSCLRTGRARPPGRRAARPPTSAPTHSPKTSTSPRWPTSAHRAGR